MLDPSIKRSAIYHHYQPIVDLADQKIIGFEALFRSDFSSDPELTFQAARARKKLYELDSRSIHKAVQTYRLASPKIDGRKLFLNVCPSTVLNVNFPSFMDSIMRRITDSSQAFLVVLEILENEKIGNFPLFIKRLHSLKEKGVLIAIDDFSKGMDDINRTIELDADYLKLDRYFSIGLSHSRKKQAYIQFLIQYCREFGTTLIIEGLETPEQIEKVRQLGVRYAQGFGLGKPGPLEKVI